MISTKYLLMQWPFNLIITTVKAVDPPKDGVLRLVHLTCALGYISAT